LTVTTSWYPPSILLSAPVAETVTEPTRIGTDAVEMVRLVYFVPMFVGVKVTDNVCAPGLNIVPGAGE
jgi:hypothetical protein